MKISLNSHNSTKGVNNSRGLKKKIQKTYVIIILLIGIGLAIRFHYFIPEIPLTTDALSYFFYAVDISVTEKLPMNYSPPNNGWPIFVSFFFRIFTFENTLEFMQLQKILTITISTITVIPLYFLCRKFFNEKISIVASSIFILDPRIIFNSLAGITEPLYILLCTTSLTFFLSERKSFVYFSFIAVSFASLIRSEGLFLFFALSILFLIKFRKDRYVVLKYLPALAIALIILLPMISYRVEAVGYDSLFGRIIDSLNYVFEPLIENDGDQNYGFESTSKLEPTNSGIPYISTGIENFTKFFGWSLIPIFIFFVPIGFFIFLKKIEVNRLTIIISGICISLPAFHAYGSDHLDTRYLFMLYPFYCIIAGFTIEKILRKTNQKEMVSIVIILLMIIVSISFIEIRDMEQKLENEYTILATKIAKLEAKTNSFYPASNYLETAQIPSNFKDLEKYFFKEREEKLSIRFTIPQKSSIIEIENAELNKFMKNAEKNSITHLVIDLEGNRPEFFKDIFENEIKFPFLEKVYDSKDEGFYYHVKIFKINYEIFGKLIKNN